jgi:hypothetical protein
MGMAASLGFVFAKTTQPPTVIGKGTMEVDLAAQPGVDNTGKTECAAAVQSALDSCAALGVRAVARGTIKTASTLTIGAPVDLTDLTVNYSGTRTAILVGTTVTTATLNQLGSVRLPRVVATAKTNNGWTQVAGSVGIQISNVNTANIYVPGVAFFETGLELHAAGQGVSYNNVFLGSLTNNKVNCLFSADTTGWANQNQIYGGRMSHSSDEGTQVPGTRHVRQAATKNTVNGNSFYGTSFESPDVVEYHIESAGISNTWYSCRFENTVKNHTRIWSRTGASRNTISQGYGSENIYQVYEGTANPFNIISGSGAWLNSGFDTQNATLRLQNNASSSLPTLTICAAGETGDPTTRYTTRMDAWTLRAKTSSDVFDRVIVDGSDSSLSLGPGDTEIDVVLSRGAPNVLALGAANVFVTGKNVTASRPLASIGAGAQFYDTTLHKPIWSDGATWRDASGASI